MKPSVADDQKSKGVSFSLKPDLHQQLLKRVELLGYPWTKSAYVTKLVIEDLAAHGLWPVRKCEAAVVVTRGKTACAKSRNEEDRS